MRIDRYFYISALPALGELGSAPLMGQAELLEHLGKCSPRGELVGTLLLFDDLLQREAFLAGEIEQVEPVVLTVPQARNEAPLPKCLAPSAERESQGTIETDVLWETYFRHATEVGRAAGSQFLGQWAGFEVALRNALAAARAKRLGLDEAGYLVAEDLAEGGEEFSAVLSEWETATTPLVGLRVVIRARWSWVDRNDAWYSFSEDELLVYAARLMLLEQWRRSSEEDERATAPATRQ